MTFAKYAFPEGVWEQLKKTIQDQDQYIDCAVVELGHLCKRFDDENNCVERCPLYAVDVLWLKDIPKEFNQYEVFPQPGGIHVFAGCEDMYLERYLSKGRTND